MAFSATINLGTVGTDVITYGVSLEQCTGEGIGCQAKHSYNRYTVNHTNSYFLAMEINSKF